MLGNLFSSLRNTFYSFYFFRLYSPVTLTVRLMGSDRWMSFSFSGKTSTPSLLEVLFHWSILSDVLLGQWFNRGDDSVFSYLFSVSGRQGVAEHWTWWIPTSLITEETPSLTGTSQFLIWLSPEPYRPLSLAVYKASTGKGRQGKCLTIIVMNMLSTLMWILLNGWNCI